MNKKRSWSDIFSIVCLFVGLSLIFIVIDRKDTTNKKQMAYLEKYQNIQGMNKREVLADTTKILKEGAGNKNKGVGEEEIPIGILSIPKIEVTTVVLEGVNQQTLRYAVAHYEDTPLPSERGNFCVIGHRSYSYGEFFNRLDEIEIGDAIYMEVSGKQYQYKTKEILVVEPEEIWVLDDTNETMITLITCTPIRVGTHRLIVRATLET